MPIPLTWTTVHYGNMVELSMDAVVSFFVEVNNRANRYYFAIISF